MGRNARATSSAYIEERRARVAELLLQRKSYRAIGAEIGVSTTRVSRDVKVIREAWRERRHQAIDEHVTEELARLQAAEQALWDKVVAGDLAAIDVLLRIQSRRSALLGLDAPVTSQTMHSGIVVIRTYPGVKPPDAD